MGVSERKHREKEQRKNNIIKAAKRLFKNKGFEETTMQMIARQAELSKGALYLYFRDKDEIIASILLEASKALGGLLDEAISLGKNAFDKINRIIFAYLKFRRESPESYFFTLLLDYKPLFQLKPKNPELIEQMQYRTNMLKDILRLGVEDGTIRPDIDPAMTASVLAHLGTASMMQRVFLTDEYIKTVTPYNVEELTGNLVELISSALKNPAYS